MLHKPRSYGHTDLFCHEMNFQTLKFLPIWLVLGLFVLLFGCETSEVNPAEIPSGKEYYPIQVGSFWIYKVDSLEYTFTGEKRQGSFYYKEFISDTLPDQEGSKVYRIEVSTTLDTNSGWHLDSVWSVSVGNTQIIKTENNRPLVKLYFPLKEGSRWDGNQYNTLRDSNDIYWYRVVGLGKPATFGNQQVESVQIVQKKDSNCVNFSYFTEIYFKNIGLAYRRKTYFDYKSCIGVPEIEQGRSFEYLLIAHGKN